MLAEVTGPAVEPVGLGELRAYLRLGGGDDEATLAGALRSARALCEAFTGLWPIRRTVVETLPLVRGSVRLSGAPLVAVTLVERIAADGSAAIVPAGAFAVEVDAHGAASLFVAGEAARVRATYGAGMAADWNGVPEPIRHGLLRMAAHLFETRGGAADVPPAAVAALWRPYRRLRLG